MPLAAVVAQAPPTDLEARARAGGEPAAAVRALLGGPPEAVPERYRAASPAALLPLGVPFLLVQGEADPMVDPAGSRRYVEAARAGGDRAALVLRSGDDHGVHLDPRSVAWHAALAWLEPWGP